MSNPGPEHKASNPIRIAKFLDGYLGKELLMDLELPKNLYKNHNDMTCEEKNELFEFSYNVILREAGMELTDLLRRNPSLVELNLMQRRIMNFLKSQGMSYEK